MIAVGIDPSISGIDPGELCRGSTVDAPCCIRRAVERGIVTHDDDTIGRQMYIEFQPVGTGCQPTLERGNGVLRAECAPAPVCKDAGTRCPLEESHD